MAKRQQKCSFKDMQLFKNDTLGTGSYGIVCKAKCDQLLCAAKITRYPIDDELGDKFEEILSIINHPNIVQYLGAYNDPETNALVLLTELMDENLTHFLESSTGDVLYHTQVNLSHDIAQALAFLHSNKVIHSNLSSNNVLLIAGTLAKVADFGVSKLVATNTTQVDIKTNTAYMSPEALDQPQEITEKLDNFSFGVLLIQIATRKFPMPTNRFKTNKLNSSQTEVRAPTIVPEIERRQAQIDLILPDHPLLPTALDCLKDKKADRPTAEQLCQTINSLKIRLGKGHKSSEQDLQKQLRDKNFQLQEKDIQLQAYKETLAKKNQELYVLIRKKLTFRKTQVKMIQEIAQKNVELFHQFSSNFDETLKDLQRQVEEKVKTISAKLQSSIKNVEVLQQTIQRRIRKEKQLRQSLDSKNEQTTQIHPGAIQNKKYSPLPPIIGSDKKPTPQTRPARVPWAVPDALVEMWQGSTAVVGNKIYFKPKFGSDIHIFSNSQWINKLPCPSYSCSIIKINDKLMTVGGWSMLNFYQNQLYSYNATEWVKCFDPMPTKRCNPAAVYANNKLIVAGGLSDFKSLNTVEILDIANKQWSCAAALPVGMYTPSATICENCVYVHSRAKDPENFVYKSSLEQLVHSSPNNLDIWEKIAPLPISNSSLVTLNDHVLAVGGEYCRDDENEESASNIIYEYNSIEQSWSDTAIRMQSPRTAPLIAALPNNRLMVVGGGQQHELKTCELLVLRFFAC